MSTDVGKASSLNSLIITSEPGTQAANIFNIRKAAIWPQWQQDRRQPSLCPVMFPFPVLTPICPSCYQ